MDLLNKIAHLWPNFGAILNGSTEGVSALFWLIMTFVFALALVSVGWHFLRYRSRISALRSLLEGQTKETLAQNRREVQRRAEQLGAGNVGSLWKEFDESLVATADQSKLFNTLDAEHFFNGRTLARGLTASRLLAATPSFLVAMGVLGTFVGLTMGLAALQVNSQEVEGLKEGISQMIQGASVAFLTSVWGVLYSLVLNLVEKLAERSALGEISELQHRIDFLYPRIPAEQSLVHIADHTRESKLALQELHERIGDRLQESLQGMSDAMQQALSDTLNSIMGPAIQALVTNAGQQSTQVLEQLVHRFMEGMSEAGRDQGERLAGAASSLQAAAGDLGDKLSTLMTEVRTQQEQERDRTSDQTRLFDEQIQRLATSADEREQALNEGFEQLMQRLGQLVTDKIGASERRDEERDASLQSLLQQVAGAMESSQSQALQMAEQHKQLLSRLHEVSEGVERSSKHMDASANQLGLLSANVRQTSETLGVRLDGMTSQVQEAAKRNQEVASQVAAQVAALGDLQALLLEGARSGEEAARLASEGFKALRQHQEAFLAALRKEFTQVGEVLRKEFQSLEKQTHQWLLDYSKEVSGQVQSRMEQWNSVSINYANEMQRAVQAISSIVDELGARQ